MSPAHRLIMSDSPDYYAVGYQAFIGEADKRKYSSDSEDVKAYLQASAAAASAAACTAMGLPIAAPACAAIGSEVAGWLADKVFPEVEKATKQLFQSGAGADTVLGTLRVQFDSLSVATGSREVAEKVVKEFYPGWLPYRRWEGYVFPNYRIWFASRDPVTGKRMDCASLYDHVSKAYSKGVRGPCVAARHIPPMISAVIAANAAWQDYSKSKRAKVSKGGGTGLASFLVGAGLLGVGVALLSKVVK